MKECDSCANRNTCGYANRKTCAVRRAADSAVAGFCRDCQEEKDCTLQDSLMCGCFKPTLITPQTILRDGEPCSHPGCLSHISHPCEGCGRVAGFKPTPPPTEREAETQAIDELMVKLKDMHPPFRRDLCKLIVRVVWDMRWSQDQAELTALTAQLDKMKHEREGIVDCTGCVYSGEDIEKCMKCRRSGPQHDYYKHALPGGCGKPGHVTATGDEGTSHCQTCEEELPKPGEVEK